MDRDIRLKREINKDKDARADQTKTRRKKDRL